MRPAVTDGDALGAPSVGRWQPVVGVGAPVRAGTLLGHLWRAGRPLEVCAPRQCVSGMAAVVAPAGLWVEYGQAVVTVGIVDSQPEQGGESAGEPGLPDGVLVVRADTDGTIYLSPEPGRPAFVSRGDRVTERTPLALVEVMKTFSPIRSPVTGTVERVCVDTGDAVEADQVLFWMREDG